MHTSRVDHYLSISTANILRSSGLELSRPTPELQELVDTDAWKEIFGLGPKRRDELSHALTSARQRTHKSIEAAIELLEEHGYTVNPP
tara:strand:+ start:1327 stop:1590 length:264 start_codon:yes stop_codon:yes gene_type:complete